MEQNQTLSQHLASFAGTDEIRLSVALTVQALAAASVDIAALLAGGGLAEKVGGSRGRNAGGDVQTELDLATHRIVRGALTAAPVAAFASEEAAVAEILNVGGAVSVAVDPLDGSANVENNTSVGTIFSILPTPADLAVTFHQPGTCQLAAGFTLYGPQTLLVLTLGEGVHVFTLDPADRAFKLVRRNTRIPAASAEFAINMSNQRHWDPPIRAYVEDCLNPFDEIGGPMPNMRWLGALVAEAYRILTRGGIYLYPADARSGYGEGRLRLVYEAHPMAFLFEQAGGSASTGLARILDLAATALHQRVPLIMGSSDNLRQVERLHLHPNIVSERRAPLFATRGFFRL